MVKKQIFTQYNSLKGKYENQYIALNKKGDKVVASGETISEVEKYLQKNHINASIIEYVLPLDSAYFPYLLC